VDRDSVVRFPVVDTEPSLMPALMPEEEEGTGSRYRRDRSRWLRSNIEWLLPKLPPAILVVV
jgi:hypothetical protein